MLYLRSFNRFILIGLALLGLSVSSVNASILLSEDFEDGLLDPLTTLQTLNLNSSGSGIKGSTFSGSTKAFGFGRSTCQSNCFQQSYIVAIHNFSKRSIGTSDFVQIC